MIDVRDVSVLPIVTLRYNKQGAFMGYETNDDGIAWDGADSFEVVESGTFVNISGLMEFDRTRHIMWKPVYIGERKLYFKAG